MGRLNNLLCALLLAAPAGCAHKEPSVHISRPYANKPVGYFTEANGAKTPFDAYSGLRNRTEYRVSNYPFYPHNFTLVDDKSDGFIDDVTYSLGKGRRRIWLYVNWDMSEDPGAPSMKRLVERVLEIKPYLREQIKNEPRAPEPSEEDKSRGETETG